MNVGPRELCRIHFFFLLSGFVLVAAGASAAVCVVSVPRVRYVFFHFVIKIVILFRKGVH